jgi:hypothetical protein
MKSRALLVVLIASTCLPALRAQTAPSAGDPLPAPTGSGSAPPISGTVSSDVYTSATGAFRIKIPVLPQLGGAISDTPNVVTFDDDFTTHISIGAFPLSHEMKWEYDTRGTKDFLAYFFASFVMPDFVSRFPGARMEDTGVFLPKYLDGAMLIGSLLPGGSFFAQRATLTPPTEPIVAKRGNLCFVKNGYVFVVSTELPERVLERSTFKKTAEEENTILRDRLMAVVSKMEFIPPPEAKN